METLGGKREKITPTATISPVISDEKAAEENKKAVGWKYRYRVSKMQEAQKREAAEELLKAESKKHEHVPAHEKLDPVLARLTPEERAVGWQYRLVKLILYVLKNSNFFSFSFSYRIRRKLDAIKNATRDTGGGKRSKKQKELSRKQKEKEKFIKKVEETIEEVLNIDDIDETPFMEYVRRGSVYIFSGLLPTAKRSICLLPLPVTFSFCNENKNEIVNKTLTTTELPPPSKQIPTKKLRTKKEKRAKQFIHSRPTRLGAIDEKTDESIKPLSKIPTTTTEKPHVQKKQPHQRLRSSTRRSNDEQIKHFDEEEEPVKKLVGVESKKKKNKKRFQIIGQEVKIKPKHSASLPVTNPPPIVTTSPPIVEIPKTPPPPSPSPPSPKPEIVSTTTHAPLRSISEIIQEEAATLLSTQSSFSEEAKEETNEANENLQTTTTTLPPDLHDSTTSTEDHKNAAPSDSESSASDGESNSNEETEEKADPAPIKKIKQFYENAKESVHGVFDLNDEKASS
jgi:hypothetical protein